MTKRWMVQPYDQTLVRKICERHGVSAMVAKILASREITDEAQLDSFFDSRLTLLRPPEQLPGCRLAAEVLLEAVKAKRRIVVYGDYDCDGMTASAILVTCLKRLGGTVSCFVPNRLDDGYGLNRDQLRKLAAHGAEVVVTVDCGISSFEEVGLAKELGLTVVVTDHHLPGPQLPNADAIVHPGLPDMPYPFPGLCGAGVAFKLAWAMCQRHCGSEKLPGPFREMLFSLLALAAVGTVADVVPLVDENRVLVRHGLKLLRTHAPLGLQCLLAFLNLPAQRDLNAEDIGFGLAPRLNAAGRLGQAQLGVELLVCENQRRAEQLAEYINNLNKSRESLERAMVREANRQIQEQFDSQHDPAFVLADAGWHQGVIGIVAGRLAEKYQRPVIVLRSDSLSSPVAIGSARSAAGIHLFEILDACRQHLVTFGGHAAAAGLTLEHAAIPAFREAFCEQVSERTPPGNPVAELMIDAEVALCELTLETVRSIESMAPFGNGNARPILCVNQVWLQEPPRTMGADGRHLSLRIRQDQVRMSCVAFGQAEWAEHLDPSEPYDFAFKPAINDFQGRTQVQLQLIDYRPAGVRAAMT